MCRNRVFYEATEFWLSLEGFLSQQNILCHDRVWPKGRIGLQQDFPSSQQRLAKEGDFMLRQGIRCRDRESCWLGRFHVATEFTMSRQGMEAAEGLVSQHDFPCRDRGCLDEGIFRSRHRILSHDRKMGMKENTMSRQSSSVSR